VGSWWASGGFRVVVDTDEGPPLPPTGASSEVRTSESTPGFGDLTRGEGGNRDRKLRQRWDRRRPGKYAQVGMGTRTWSR